MDTNTHTQQLPTPVRAFVEAHEARDPDAALAVMTTRAVIADDGTTYSGEEALRHFITDAGTEFTYTDEITGTSRDGDVWVVHHHLDGDFPGGTVDLDYRFALEGDRVARLDIVVG